MVCGVAQPVIEAPATAEPGPRLPGWVEQRDDLATGKTSAQLDEVERHAADGRRAVTVPAGVLSEKCPPQLVSGGLLMSLRVEAGRDLRLGYPGPAVQCDAHLAHARIPAAATVNREDPGLPSQISPSPVLAASSVTPAASTIQELPASRG
jgi:hypothetical protein